MNGNGGDPRLLRRLLGEGAEHAGVIGSDTGGDRVAAMFGSRWRR
jgi:hypothetical protein